MLVTLFLGAPFKMPIFWSKSPQFLHKFDALRQYGSCYRV